MLLKDLIHQGIVTVSSSYPEREAREMVMIYLCEKIGVKRYTHIIEPDYELEESVVETALSAFKRLSSGEPLQYIMGHTTFYGRSFRVSSHTLIPRPETELMCRMAIERICKLYQPHILDVCTGSGCIAWTLALELPGASVSAVELSENALSVASSQEFSTEISEKGIRKPVFFKADVLETDGLNKLFSGEKFDLIISNPPYVMDCEKVMMRSNVLDYEPHMALFVSDDDPLVFYRALAHWAAALLSLDGIGLVEINESLGERTAEVFRLAGFGKVEVFKDLYDKDRYVCFSY